VLCRNFDKKYRNVDVGFSHPVMPIADTRILRWRYSTPFYSMQQLWISLDQYR